MVRSSSLGNGQQQLLTSNDSVQSLDEDSGLLIANLVTSDEAIVPTIRSVLERGWADRFTGSLDQFVTQKENELRNLCNFHFDEFSEGVNDISKLKTNSEKLRKRLQDMEQELQSKGKHVLKSGETLLRFYRVDRHLTQSKKDIRRTLNLLALVKRARQEVADKSYFKALQTVDLVREVIHGEQINDLWQQRKDGCSGLSTFDATESRSKFVDRLEEWIPRIVDRIRHNVDKEVTEYFVLARDKAGPIGSRALEMVSKRQLQTLPNANTASSNRKTIRKASINRLRSRASSDILLEWEHREPTSTVDIAETCLDREINFSPVYQYLDIQEYLGARDAASEFYKKNRLPQASLQTMIPVDLRKLQPGQFHKYARPLFERITGFFIIEVSVTRAVNLISPYELSVIWDSILDQLLPTIKAELRLSHQTDPRSTLDLIQLLINISKLLGRNRGSEAPKDANTQSEDVLFGTGAAETAATLSSNKILDASRLLDVCFEERKSVANILVEFGWSEMQEIINQEKCIPLVLKNVEDEFYHTVTTFGLVGLDMDDDKSKHQTEFALPLQLKFSETVPRICRVVVNLLDRAFCLARQLGGYLPQGDDDGTSLIQGSSFVTSAACAARLANACLEKLNATLEQVIQGDNASAEILCQYSVNLWYLYKCNDNLVAHAKSLANTTEGEEESMQQKWWSMPVCESFQLTAELAQTRVMQSIHEKIDELLSGRFSVDWTPKQISKEPHFFVSDTIQYLSVTFGKDSCLRLLPSAKIQATHFTSCGRISEAIFDLLVGDRVNAINALSVFTLSQDIELLFDFCAKSNVPDLRECFTQLEQIVNLFVKGDLIRGYLDFGVRGREYGYLTPSSVVKVCRKYKQIDTSSRLYASAQFALIMDTDIKKTIKELT